MFRHRQLLALALILVPLTGFAAEKADSPRLPEQEKFHIYLLMGQSNMAGRGKMTDEDKSKSHPRVLKMDRKYQWVPATDPLHFDKPTIAGVGPGSGFGPAMAEADESVVIGLVPCSFGGSPLSRWVEGGDLYKNAIARARKAAEHGTLKGIIWHQGENDSRLPETASTYQERLTGMIAAFRAELKSPELPVVVGELSQALVDSPKLPLTQQVNIALRKVAEADDNVTCVPSAGLTMKADGVHFDAKSAREFGQRYARAMQELQAKPAREK